MPCVIRHLTNNYLLNFQHEHNLFFTDVSERTGREDINGGYKNGLSRDRNKGALSEKPWLWTCKNISTQNYTEALKCCPSHSIIESQNGLKENLKFISCQTPHQRQGHFPLHQAAQTPIQLSPEHFQDGTFTIKEDASMCLLKMQISYN